MENKWYVYRHRTVVGNRVFYIGIGSTPKYHRAKTRHGRNVWWKRTVDKYGFSSEILSHNLSNESAKDLEILLISYYKRADSTNGLLVNLTDGGDGSVGVIKTPDQIAKWKQSNKGKQDGARNIMFGRNKGLHHRAKDVLCLRTGIYYDCALEASEARGISYSTLKSVLQKRITNNVDLMYADECESGESVFIKAPKNQRKIIDTKTLAVFPCMLEASKACGIHKATLTYQLKNGISKNHNLQYLIEYESENCADSNRGHKKYVLDFSTGIFYDSLRECSNLLNIKYTTLKNWLGEASTTRNPSTLKYA